jgi:hypothetical protein
MSTLRVDNIKSRTGSVLTVPETNTLAVTGIVSVTSSGSLQVAGDETIGGNQTVSGVQTISGQQLITGQQLISGISTVTGSFNVSNGINVTAGVATFAGDVSIGGTLTYEDVTNIDAVGLITARNGINMSGGTATFAGAIDANGGADIAGGLVVNSAKVSDLTSGRVVFAGTSGELQDASTLTFSGGTLSATTFSGAVTGNADTATLATNVTVTDNESTNENNLIAFVADGGTSTGSHGLEMDGDLTYTPNLGRLTATQLSGTLQTAAQTNITSLGTLSALTVSGNINANGNIAGDSSTNITGINGITATQLTGTLQTAAQTNITSVGTLTGLNISGDLNITDSIYHTGDLNTRIAFPSGDQILLQTGGIETIKATTTGVTFKSAQEGQIVIQDSDTGNTGSAAETGIKFADGGGTQQSIIGHHSSGSTDLFIETSISANIGFKINNTQVLSMESSSLLPHSDNTYNLGSSSKRFANLYTGDINLCNSGVTNEVDGTWGSYTMQEGENDLFLINRRSGKKYRFNLTEV